MDSLTQIVLGAACGEAVLGKKIGNKALLFGALGGTIPDLDVFVGKWLFDNEIQSMAFHRGFMHSISFALMAVNLVICCFGVIIVGIASELPPEKVDKTVFWSIFTHQFWIVLPYGTQLFAPFSNWVAFNNISVADLLYTLPFLCV